MHLKVIPIIRRPSYTLGVEQWDDVTLVHCEVTHWNHAVYKAMKKDFKALCDLHGGPFRALDNGAPTQAKFLRMFGFRCIGTALNSAGKRMPLYERKSDG